MKRTDRKAVVSWGLWDMGSAAFNAVMVTFIFSVYLKESVGKDITHATGWFSLALAISGILIAVFAPVSGQRSDARGTRRHSVRVWTLITTVLIAAMFFVRNDDPRYFWLGITGIALASITFELAEVSYFAMLNQVSTKDNVGRVSGFGWALGYFGGIILLLICYLFFVSNDGGLLHISTESGLNIRLVAIVSALWFLGLALPTMFVIPEITPNNYFTSTSLVGSYKELFATIATLWREDRNSLRFLISSAIFRDGVAGIFSFGAILAVSVYGLSAAEVLLFGVAANIISALGALTIGVADDKFGSKPVILFSLFAMIATSIVLLFVNGPSMFWIFGLILCLFVGPAQSASRTFLSRIAEDDREGQMFGLYATTGRSVSWLSPLAFSTLTFAAGNDRAGIIGIALIILLGAVLMLFVKQPVTVRM